MKNKSILLFLIFALTTFNNLFTMDLFTIQKITTEKQEQILSELQDQAKLVEDGIKKIQNEKFLLQQKLNDLKTYAKNSCIITKIKNTISELEELNKQEILLQDLAKDFSNKIELYKYKITTSNLFETVKTFNILETVDKTKKIIQTYILNMPRLNPNMGLEEIINQASIHATKKLNFSTRAKLIAQNQIKISQAFRHPVATPIASIFALLGLGTISHKVNKTNAASRAALLKAQEESKRPLTRICKGVKYPFSWTSKKIANGTKYLVTTSKKHPYVTCATGAIAATTLAYVAYKYYQSINNNDNNDNYHE